MADLGASAAAIGRSGLTIYDPIPRHIGELWIPTFDLERQLNGALKGAALSDLPLRTRSKVVKEHICRALGYPVPPVFRRTRPRFPGQNFDVYVQKSDNVQIWNEELEPARRYVIVHVGQDDAVTGVRVVTGQELARLDTTGTLTQKYQARMTPTPAATELVVEVDTTPVQALTSDQADLSAADPTALPRDGDLLSIASVFDKLRGMIGTRFDDPGRSQERNRGAVLHQLVCERLGYRRYGDDGRFPDVRNQLLEVKLQTSATIDLGLVDPHSEDLLDMPQVGGVQIRHCDVRYAVFGATTDGREVALTGLIVTTGEMFFARLPQFEGRVLNKKLQIRLPSGFFANAVGQGHSDEPVPMAVGRTPPKP